MTLTMVLAQIIGAYLLIAGMAVLANRRHIMLAVVAIARERFAQLVAGILALLVGLVIVTIHNDWSSMSAAIITTIGWLGILKGIFYLFVPEAHIGKVVASLTDRKWYAIDGALAIALGLYLLNAVHGWF